MNKYLLFLSAVLLFAGTACAQVQIKEKSTKQLKEVEPAKPVDIPDPTKLESHAVLTLLSDDVELNAKLIDKGFSSLVERGQVCL